MTPKKQTSIFGAAASTVAVTAPLEAKKAPEKKAPSKKRAAKKKAAPTKVFVQAHMDPTQIEPFDALLAEHGLTRAEAVRALIELTASDPAVAKKMLRTLGRRA